METTEEKVRARKLRTGWRAGKGPWKGGGAVFIMVDRGVIVGAVKLGRRGIPSMAYRLETDGNG